MDKLEFEPIGVIRSPFRTAEGTPIQPRAADGAIGYIDLEQKYSSGLAGLDKFSHIILIYHFHLSRGYNLQVVPFLDQKTTGLFSTRAPRRPNQIGISIVRLEKIEDNRIHVRNIDVVDGTPLLDIKPFVPMFDCFDLGNGSHSGWLEGKDSEASVKKADRRFSTRQEDQNGQD